MTLSIITVNLNNATGLQRTMESILAQTCKDYEWIVIDGGSTDGSVELLRNNSSLLSYWRSEPDSGIYQAMNKGLRAATGTYVLFLNSGDCFADESVIDYFEHNHNNSDFIIGRIAWDSERPLIPTNDSTIAAEDEVFLLCVSAHPHQATFIRRDSFAEYGLYREDKRLASDWYYTVCALIKGNASIQYIPILVSVCEKGGISSRLHKELYEERKDLIRENPFFSALFNFYADNREIITALKSNRFVFLLFRCYYFIF